MRLHKGNASKYVGRVLDSKKRMFNHYPLRVLEINGKYFYTDRNKVMIDVPEERDIPNSVYFDKVII